MARIYRVLATILLVVALRNATASGISVLFVGNSLTQANDLPGVFKRFAAESSLHAQIDVHSITPGGAFLRDHWEKHAAVAALREQRPTFLVLQGQSTEPLFASESFTHYAGLFRAEATANGVTTVFLSTWARPASDPYYNEPSSGGSPDEMQRRLDAAYASVARQLGATLAPVGIAFTRARRDAPTVELLDGTQHPSPAGTYLAAAVLFRTLFSSSPLDSTFYGSLSKETALTLQHIAANCSSPD